MTLRGGVLREATLSCMANSLYRTTALGRILFNSVVMVLAYRPGVPGSNLVRRPYISAMHVFIRFFVNGTLFVRKGRKHCLNGDTAGVQQHFSPAPPPPFFFFSVFKKKKKKIVFLHGYQK